MPIRKILLTLAGSPADEAALGTALTVARLWNTHVVALHVRADPRDVAPLAGEGLSGAMIEEMMEATEREGDSRTRAAREMFERSVSAEGIALSLPRLQGEQPSASFATVTGHEEEVAAYQARLADLTIVPCPASKDGASSADVLHAVLFDSGRPVLLASAKKPETIGGRVCVAWNGTAEAASVVQAALPWLKRAATVRILQAEGYQRRGPAAAELALYLGLHGIEPEIISFEPVERSIGAGLLAAAHNFGADLLCMGAYSHSRLRQLILGGVTRYILEHADLPVLMNR